MKNTLLILLQIYFLFISCRKGGPCEEPLNIYNSGIVINFKDSVTQRYLYEEFNPLYNKDSLHIFDDKGNFLLVTSSLNLIPSTGLRYYVITLGPLYNELFDHGSFDSETCKEFIIQYGHAEYDTIKTCFKSENTKCGSYFATLKVYHDDSLLTSESKSTSAIITLLKN